MSAENPDDFSPPVRSETESVFFVSSAPFRMTSISLISQKYQVSARPARPMAAGRGGRLNGFQYNRKIVLVREQDQEE